MSENPTNNFQLDRPLVGSSTGRDSTDWGSELNNNFAIIDERLVAADTESDQSSYTPFVDALYYATDTNTWYVGNGSSWIADDTSGADPTFSSVTTDSLSATNTATVSGNDVLTTADTGSGNGLVSDTVDGYHGDDLAARSEQETIQAQWSHSAKSVFNSTIDVYGSDGQVQLFDSSDSDKEWDIEIQNGGLLFTETGVGSHLQVNAADGGVDHPTGGSFGSDVAMQTNAIRDTSTLTLTPQSSAPSNPTSGMMAAADGTNWDPAGSGAEELVVYLNGGWIVLT